MLELRHRSVTAFPRRVLVATVGLVPQVVTETIYALATDSAHAFVPTEVHVITTSVGAKTVADTLIGEDGMVSRLAAELETPGLAHALAPDRVHVIRDADAKVLSDINSASDHDATAD